MKPEVKRVRISCRKCKKVLLIIYNTIVPFYANMDLMCYNCSSIISKTTDVIIEKSELDLKNEMDASMIKSYIDPEKYT